jgi:hypothetical protein
VKESQGAESAADFIHKLKIARKEARETRYWLRLLKETNYITKDELILKSEELIKILTSIILSTERKGNSPAPPAPFKFFLFIRGEMRHLPNGIRQGSIFHQGRSLFHWGRD